jgi:hypothetical protein
VKTVLVGVGIGGIFLPSGGNCALPGVMGDSSFVAIDKFLMRRLDDDRFFLIGAGGGIILVNLDGDAGGI